MNSYLGWTHLLLATAVFSLLWSGCAPVYTSSARHTHLMDKKGELHASVMVGTNGADVQAAYAVSDRVGVIGTISNGETEVVGLADEVDYHKHTYGELGLTYFSSFGRVWRIEALGGFGLGSSEAYDQYDFFGPQEVRAEGSYSNVFVQGNIGLETGVLEAGLAMRFSGITFSKFETTASTYDRSEGSIFFEPALFGRIGWKNVKFEGQVGVAGALRDVKFDYNPTFVSLGLHLQLNTQ